MTRIATSGIRGVLTAGMLACDAPESEVPIRVPPAMLMADGGQSRVNEINPRLLRRYQSVVLPNAPGPDTSSLIQLGKKLFHDEALSSDGTVSCHSCHDLQRHGADGQRVSPGVGGKMGLRNAPTVVNTALQFRQFWDGRAATLEEQVEGPLLNPAEMGLASTDDLVSRLRARTDYRDAFAQAFIDTPQPITFDNYASAIAAFERTLVTRSRWDDFLDGDRDALTREEKRGLRVFLNSGCMVCHTGPLLGGSTFERVGVEEPWPNQTDTGRMRVTNDPADLMMFKVPTLRNVAETAPYFHDGSAGSLEEAIEKMARHQLGLTLSPTDIASIATWLQSLSGHLGSAATSPP
jgi:cytochrome c peroxidase